MKRAKLKPTCFFLMANHKSAGSGATTSRIVSAQAQPQAQLKKVVLAIVASCTENTCLRCACQTALNFNHWGNGW